MSERPSSIDLTIELERQLENDQLPPSDPQRPQSLDPHVLAHIVTDLRSSLAATTRHRDELATSLAEMQAREKDLTDTLAHMTDKCSKLQEELDVAKTKARDDENSITLLRNKVEESRRGLMRLQSESRRQSQVLSGADLSRASLAPLAGASSSKRSSFAPLTGSATVRINAHRRISSVSDSGFAKLEGGSPHGSPGPSNSTFPDNAMLANKLASLPRSSFGRVSPPSPLFHPDDSAEVEMLRKELNAMRVELDEAKHELNEANEAREASELCVKALRAFIEENNIGAQIPIAGGSMVALPSSQAEFKKNTQVAGGWGFKLWGTQPLAKNPPAATPIPNIPSTNPNTPNIVSSPPPQPLTRKIGEFFGARSASISSTTPVKSPSTEQEAMYNGLSDTSSVEESVVEPASPASELPRPSVLVRDTTSVISASSARELGASPERKTDGLPSLTGVEGGFTPVAI